MTHPGDNSLTSFCDHHQLPSRLPASHLMQLVQIDFGFPPTPPPVLVTARKRKLYPFRLSLLCSCLLRKLPVHGWVIMRIGRKRQERDVDFAQGNA